MSVREESHHHKKSAIVTIKRIIAARKAPYKTRGITMHTEFQSEDTDDSQRLIELEKMKQTLEQQLQEMAKTVEKQQEMIALSRRDPLTGLRNWQGIPELVNASLCAHCEGVFFIMDLDNFKSVNDTYGHMEGDRVLVKFAKALKNAVDPEDIIARLGGDEFVTFSPGHFDKYEIIAKARRFIQQIERSLVTPGRLIRVTVSIGIASAPQEGVTYEALYANADKALYSVKNEGKNGYRFYASLSKTENSAIVYNRPHCSLEEITQKLKEPKIVGSYEVEYTNFEKIYRFMERNLIRENREVQCILFTLEEYIDANAIVTKQQLEHLQHAIVYSLRKGDVTTKYSSTQLLALLIDANRENADMVANRILRKYRAEAGNDQMNILYDIQQLMAGDKASCR